MNFTHDTNDRAPVESPEESPEEFLEVRLADRTAGIDPANYSQLNKKSCIKESAESRQLTKTPASSWTDLFLWFLRSRESTYQVDLAPQSNQQLLGVLLEGQDRIFRLGVLSGQFKVLAGKSLDLPDQLFVPGEVDILG